MPRLDRYEYFASVAMKKVSISGASWRFICASWNSYSKSESARRPRIIMRLCCWRMKSTSRPLKYLTLTRLARHYLAFLLAEGRALFGVDEHGDDEFVEERRRSLGYIDVAVRYRVERAGVHGSDHSSFLLV